MTYQNTMVPLLWSLAGMQAAEIILGLTYILTH